MPASKTRIPFRVKPMLATLMREPFDRKGRVYEEKYDGNRILAYQENRATLLAPRLVAQVSFAEWTAERKLRQPVYQGLRDDEKPEEVLLPEASR